MKDIFRLYLDGFLGESEPKSSPVDVFHMRAAEQALEAEAVECYLTVDVEIEVYRIRAPLKRSVGRTRGQSQSRATDIHTGPLCCFAAVLGRSSPRVAGWTL